MPVTKRNLRCNTKAELTKKANQRGIPVNSSMKKPQLVAAVRKGKPAPRGRRK